MLTCRVKSGAAPRMCAAATPLLAIALSSGCGWDAPSASGATTEDPARPEAFTVLAQRDAQPGWAIPYGGEFWRRRAPERDPAVGAPGATVSTGIDIGDVVDRVSHALERAAPGDFPHANSATFAVALDGRGLRFTPYRPGAGGASQLAAHVQPPRPGAAPGTPPALLAHGPAERMLGRAVPDPGVAATIRTTRMTLGDRTIPAASAWSVYGNTAQAALDPAGTIVEHQEIRGDGVELAWLLREPPPAGAAWTVELGVEGLDFRGATAAGVHFADAGGTARMVIGAAVLVDTTGKRWPIATELQGGQPRWTVPADVLASARFPVALDPAVGPEFGIDVAVPGYGSTQGLGGLAWNGSSYLIVWEDNRTATGTIFGARADAAGTVLDPLGVRLSPPTGYQFGAAVAANGTDWLVTWSEQTAPMSYAVRGTRIAADGTVRDPAGIVLSAATGSRYAVDVAANGADWLVVWNDFRNQDVDVYGTRVALDGTVRDPAGLALSTATNGQGDAAVVANGSNWLVTWTDYRTGDGAVGGIIYGTRVAADGTIQDPAGLALSTATHGENSPSVAANGTDWLVAWHDYRSGTAFDIYGTRVAADGTVREPSGLPLAVAPYDQTGPSVGSNGTDWLVTWGDRRSATNDEAYGTRVAADGTVRDPAGLALATGPGRGGGRVASNGTEWLVAYGQGGFAGGVDGTRVAVDGTVRDPAGLTLARGPVREVEPAAAAGPGGYLVTWVDYRNYPGYGLGVDIYGARVSSAGVVQDVNGLALATGRATHHAPAAATNGTDWLVAWQEYRIGTAYDIYGTRLAADGTVRDAVGIPLSTVGGDQTNPTLAANGTDWLVVWDDQRSAMRNIYGTRVAADGTVRDAAGLTLAPGTGPHGSPSIAANGTDWLVAWQGTGSGAFSDIYGARVATDGTIRDAAGIPLAPGTNYATSPAVAANGTDWLVVWSTYSVTFDIYGTRVAADGTVRDPGALALSTATGHQQYPTVAANGIEWLVAWDDKRGGSSTDIYGTRVAANGTVRDAGGLSISTSSHDESGPTLASGVGLPFLVTYFTGSRAAARFISDGCGNGALDLGEGCDDGDETAGDGCSAMCAVEPGFSCVGAPSICSDVDECAATPAPCDVHAICTNNPGAFTCACAPGFTGDGMTCAATATPDGGEPMPDAGEMTSDGGGGCSTKSPTGGGALGLLALALAGSRRRRRRLASPLR